MNRRHPALSTFGSSKHTLLSPPLPSLPFSVSAVPLGQKTIISTSTASGFQRDFHVQPGDTPLGTQRPGRPLEGRPGHLTTWSKRVTLQSHHGASPHPGLPWPSGPSLALPSHATLGALGPGSSRTQFPGQTGRPPAGRKHVTHIAGMNRGRGVF